MATSSSLIKSILHKAFAEGVYRDIVNRSSSFYYFLGKTLTWENDAAPPYPIDSLEYERAVRNEIITFKEIKASDVAFVIPRINWTSGEVYDMYDDAYSDEVIGIDVVNGGSDFTSVPSITITGGGGQGATAEAYILDGKIVDVVLTSRGFGYTSAPTVTVVGGGGTGAVLRGVVNIAISGAQQLEDARFYVVTEEFNVYKCLDNNNNSQSTVKPLGTQIEPIYTQDGYVWKYMYNVPIVLRNKFLTDDQIPVSNALTNQFYANGTIESVIITNRGTGYTSATATVLGDGYLEADPVYLNTIIMSNGGADYEAPVVSINPPVSNYSEFIALGSVFFGQIISNSLEDYYEVVSAGTLASSEPTHRFGTVINGSASLKYVGTRAKGTVNFADGVITGVTLLGGVRSVDLINFGSGYTNPPIVTFSGGGGSGASAYADTRNGSVLRIIVTNLGDGYTSPPTVVIGQPWIINASVSIGDQVFVSNRLYTVTTGGTFSSTAPTHTTGSATNGSAVLAYAGTTATATCSLKYGAGYSSAPNVVFSDGTLLPGTGATGYFTISKSEARLVPIIEDGQITSMQIDDGGVGYTAATITIAGTGQNGAAVADLNIGNIRSLQANNELLTAAGSLNAIAVVSGGYDYTNARVDIIGDGQGAKATVQIDATSGKISKINMVTSGTGYTYADIVITGNGFGAKARAIISPYGGHGKNSQDELFCRTLMFYSTLANDLNQGIEVNNDYRQIGIVRNPRIFNGNNKFSGNIGSSCFVAEATIDTSKFFADQEVYKVVGTEWQAATSLSEGDQVYNGENLYVATNNGTTGLVAPNHLDGNVLNGSVGMLYIGTSRKRFRLVTVKPSSALMLSLDNEELEINDIIKNYNGDLFGINSFGTPTVDKYSGQLMFIDNKQGFTPSADETVILRTVIRF